jgi:hypothetical protein
VVIVVGPDRHLRLGLVDGRVDPLRAEPRSDRSGDVTAAGFVERLIRLDGEDVDLLDAHAANSGREG